MGGIKHAHHASYRRPYLARVIDGNAMHICCGPCGPLKRKSEKEIQPVSAATIAVFLPV